jgi:hypothetical protein
MGTKILKDGMVRLCLVYDIKYRIVVTNPEGEEKILDEFDSRAKGEEMFETLLTGLGSYVKNQLRAPFYAFRETLERMQEVFDK